LLVGAGILIFFIYSSSISYHRIFLTEDFTLAMQLITFTENPSLETIEENIDGVSRFIEFMVGLAGIIIGILIMIIGGIKLIFEKRNTKESSNEKKPVILILQIIGSAFPGFDLLVIFRIRKLRLGSMPYATQYAIWIGAYFSNNSDLEIIAGVISGIGYAVIVFFWSRKWNKQFSENIGTINSE